MSERVESVGGGRRSHADPRPLWLGAIMAVVGAVAATLATRALLLTVLDVPPEFPPLAGPGPTIFLTVVGAVGAVVVFAILGRVSSRPVARFRRVALIALVLSFLPDVWLLTDGAAGAFPGATPAAVGTLMVLHIVAAGVVVWALTAGPQRST
jgi:hypothetical protein